MRMTLLGSCCVAEDVTEFDWDVTSVGLGRLRDGQGRDWSGWGHDRGG